MDTLQFILYLEAILVAPMLVGLIWTIKSRLSDERRLSTLEAKFESAVINCDTRMDTLSTGLEKLEGDMVRLEGKVDAMSRDLNRLIGALEKGSRSGT